MMEKRLYLTYRYGILAVTKDIEELLNEYNLKRFKKLRTGGKGISWEVHTAKGRVYVDSNSETLTVKMTSSVPTGLVKKIRQIFSEYRDEQSRRDDTMAVLSQKPSYTWPVFCQCPRCR